MSLKHDNPKGIYTNRNLPDSYMSFISNNYSLRYEDDDYVIFQKNKEI